MLNLKTSKGAFCAPCVMIRRGRPNLAVLAGFVLAACGKVRHESAARMLEDAEIRDDWLAVLLPVAIAALLALLLIILRQRRHESTGLDGLFRPYRLADVRRWWGERLAARERRRSVLREQDRANAKVVAETMRAEALRHAKAAADNEARLARKIVAQDGLTVLLQVNQRIRVVNALAASEGTLADITDDGLTLFDGHSGAMRQVAWEQVREISVRHGRERSWAVPITFAMIGSGLLGFCGRAMDELEHSTAGHYPTDPLMGWGVVTGALIAGTFGMIIMYAFSGARWRRIVAVAADSPAPTLPTFAARAAETMAGADSDDELGVEILARVVLVLIALVTFAILAQ